MKTDVVYHVSCMNHWPEVVKEQLQCLWNQRHLINRFDIYVLGGNHNDMLWLRQQVKTFFPFQATVHMHKAMLCMCEAPTIKALQQLAENRSGPTSVLYLHTKGVAHPGSLYRTLWRWHMNHFLVRQLPTAIKLAHNNKWIAASARNVNDPMPHAAGNYFLVRYDHLRRLPPFETFRNAFFQRLKIDLPHLALRHADEMWLGSTGCHGFGLTPSTDEPWQERWWMSQPELTRKLMLNHT
jgi:hypothetical protein